MARTSEIGSLRSIVSLLVVMAIAGVVVALVFDTEFNGGLREIGGALVSGAVVGVAILWYQEIAEDRREEAAERRGMRQINLASELQLWDELRELIEEQIGHNLGVVIYSRLALPGESTLTLYVHGGTVQLPHVLPVLEEQIATLNGPVLARATALASPAVLDDRRGLLRQLHAHRMLVESMQINPELWNESYGEVRHSFPPSREPDRRCWK